MTRIAVVAPRGALRAALIRLADAGCVEFDTPDGNGNGEAGHRLRRLSTAGKPAALLFTGTPDLAAWERDGRAGLLAGEVQLARHTAVASIEGEIAAIAGWTPQAQLPVLQDLLRPLGATAVALPRPRGIDPPTMLPATPRHTAFAPLIDTYTTVPYADIDPTLLAGLAYVVLFGAMFGDVGHGLLLVAIALLIRRGRPRRLAGLRPHWLFVASAGAAATVFGLLYGEAFGPTGLVPTLWLAPMEQPVVLLTAGMALGAVLLAGAYALGTVNRVREGGWALALYAPSGLAGCLLFLATALAGLSWWQHWPWVGATAAALATVALILAYIGLLVSAGGKAAGATQAAVELFDMVIRLGANLLSFARLAAFGITHAALGWIVWTATAALTGRGALAVAGAVLVFVIGNALAFGLEALVAGVQALRLEYYELFSKIFQLEGRPFRPWHLPATEHLVPTATEE
ncbi:V-type ATPase 116kDa subunit family protein [Actinoplanes sp. NPDC024001]|uniref:V-type ATPase 116kDa subunit family protein n=1 Tax=Actinoplanes sp. NPDC024001 TaxID=3154598 RepID=UPI0033F2CDAB